MRLAVGRASLTPRWLLTTGAAGLLALLACAVPAHASSSCPNEGSRTGAGANLPDCRAYEVVSPPEKNGGEVDGGVVLEGTFPSPEQAALNGEAVTYGSQTTFTEANPLSAPLTGQYISRRGPTGWYTQAITPEQDLPGGVFNDGYHSEEFGLFQGFSEDLSHTFLTAYEPSPVPGAPHDYFNPYLRDNKDASYRLLSMATPPVAPPGIAIGSAGLEIEYAGMSAEGSHVIFSANDALTAGALPGQKNLYEWSEGRLELVSTVGGEAVSGAVFGLPTKDQGGTNENYAHAISTDGSRAFWTDAGQLYMHELAAGAARTVDVSASQKSNGSGPGGADPAGPQPARFHFASADGGEVFFSSCEQLTNDSTAGPRLSSYAGCGGERVYERAEEGEDLYRYEAATGRLTDLTVDSAAGQTASVVGVLGGSTDGSRLYFVAHGALIEGAPSGPDAYDVYLWHEGSISLVTTTGPADYATKDYSATEFNNGAPNPFANGEYLLESGLARTSPNGRYLAFESSEPLTGYDSRPQSAGGCRDMTSFWASTVAIDTTGRCVEVYDYDADTARLTCVSCSARGLPPLGDSMLPMALHLITQPAGWQSSTIQQRYLLDNGRLFFDSADEVLAQASNRGELNVYEYEPAGVGSCQREGGCVALISSGTSNENSFFLDASASGDDAFFITRQQLVAQDGDQALDVYDARIDGGFATALAPPCGGEACRPPVTPAPAIYGAPPSASFLGPGDPQRPVTAPAASRKAKKHKRPRKQKKTKKKHKSRKQAVRGARARRSERGSRR
jgi:hypothetical protein